MLKATNCPREIIRSRRWRNISASHGVTPIPPARLQSNGSTVGVEKEIRTSADASSTITKTIVAPPVFYWMELETLRVRACTHRSAERRFMFAMPLIAARKRTSRDFRVVPLSEIGGLHAIIVGDSEQRSWYR